MVSSLYLMWCHNPARLMGAPGVFCINCGAPLEAHHRFCPLCGAARFTPAPDLGTQRPPPGPGTPAFRPAPPPEEASPRLRLLPYLFAIGAIFWLFQLVQFAAVVAAPNGRAQIMQELSGAGLTGDLTTPLIVESVVIFLFEIVAAALHAAAYFGLRDRRPWGWIAAVMVSAAWSLLLVGIPILYLLLQPATRRNYRIP